MLPRFEEVARLRPLALLSPGAVAVDRRLGSGGVCEEAALPQPAPYTTVVADLDPAVTGRVELTLASGGVGLTGWYDAGRAALVVTDVRGVTTRHRSRRHGAVLGPVDALALTLTGAQLTVFTRGAGEDPLGWTARGRVDLRGRVPTQDADLLASLSMRCHATAPGRVRRLRAGGFGQLGLRDVRLVSHPDGTAVREDGRLLLTASHAGPGFFGTGHTGVWSLDPGQQPRLEHRADLFFRRPDAPGVFGDHATHLVREGDRWLCATSTWGDFDLSADPPGVGVTIAETTAHLLQGRHVLDTGWLALPTDGLDSVGVWDPHLVRDDDGSWLVGYVSARRFFDFHPVLASGPALDRLTLRAAATGRRQTEGTTLARLDGAWRVLASDGRDGPRRHRARFAVLDLDLADVGALDAPYPTNIPWPTLVKDRDGWLLVTFDGTAAGGPLIGYGSHGDLVLLRTR